MSRGGPEHGLGRRRVQVNLSKFTCFTGTKVPVKVKVSKFTCFTGTKVRILTEEAGSRLALLRAMMYKRKPEADVPPKKGLIPGKSFSKVYLLY